MERLQALLFLLWFSSISGAVHASQDSGHGMMSKGMMSGGMMSGWMMAGFVLLGVLLAVVLVLATVALIKYLRSRHPPS